MRTDIRSINWHRIFLRCALIALASAGCSILIAMTIVPLIGGRFDGNGLLMCVVCAVLVSGPASFLHLLQKERLHLATEAVRALNLRLAVANRDLAERATRDGLSGLLNRTEFHRRLALLPKSPGGALYVLDIDDFKLVNDRNGHLTGDAAITAVAACLRKVFPAHALVSRTGGDEFSVCLSRIGELDACRLARRVTDEVADIELINGHGAPVSLRVSVGYVVLPVLPTNPEAAIERADEALYRAKSSGGGRIACARESAEQWEMAVS